jgi:hypothetical protein
MNLNEIVDRAKNIIINPSGEWENIVKENPSGKNSIQGYALPFLIAVAVASLIGDFLFKTRIGYGPGFILGMAILSFGMLLLTLYLSGIIVNEMAPSFQSVKDQDAAIQLVVFSYTPAFVAAIVANLFPQIAFINILGLYSIYIFWEGIGPCMKTPGKNKTTYAVVSILVIIVLYGILSVLIGVLLSSMFFTGVISPLK